MIVAKLNQSEFEYDIHSLIKAFYPSENVSATVEDKEYGEPVTSRMTVDYGENRIDISLHRQRRRWIFRTGRKQKTA